MDFLERAAKTSIQRLEQLDREINAQQQQQQQQQSNHDAREYSTKRVLPDEQLFLRTNELLEIREAQKRDLERILSKTLLTKCWCECREKKKRKRIERRAREGELEFSRDGTSRF